MLSFSAKTSRDGSLDLVTYIYSSNGRLSTIEHYFNGMDWAREYDSMFYDDQQRLVKVEHRYKPENDKEIIGYSYTLEYGGDGLPIKLVKGRFSPSSPNLITTFIHDSERRLVTLTEYSTSESSFVRYEYDGSDNVLKVFYKSLGYGDEVLGRENLEFDQSPPFYATVKDLAILYIYIYGTIPNKNNCIKTRINYAGPGSFLGSSPLTISLSHSYDDAGRITQFDDPGIYNSYDYQFHYKDLRYTCN